MLAAPDGMVPLHGHHVGGFDEGPFQVIVGLFDHPSVALLAATALDFGNRAGVAGKVTGRREPVDRADLQGDDDGQDGACTRQGLDELYAFGDLDAFLDPGFQAINVVLHQAEQFELLVHASGGFLGQGGDEVQ